MMALTGCAQESSRQAPCYSHVGCVVHASQRPQPVLGSIPGAGGNEQDACVKHDALGDSLCVWGGGVLQYAAGV